MDDAISLAAKLRLEGGKLHGFLATLSADDWQAKVYTEGEHWSVRNILAHLTTTESALLKLFEQIRLGGEGVTEDFDIDRYNASQQKKTATLEPTELLGTFQTARRNMAAFVESLSAEELERRGRHPFLGPTTLREMVKMVYIHNQTHYRDVRRVLRRDQTAA